MRTGLTVCLIWLFCSSTVWAQEVKRGPDAISYGLAAVNPALGIIQAIRAEDTKCQLAQLGVSAAIGESLAFTMQHFLVSARPCCDGNGMPSAHALSSSLGASWNWKVSWAFSLGTAEARVAAHRHTRTQALAGVGLGLLSEWAGQTIVRCRG